MKFWVGLSVFVCCTAFSGQHILGTLERVSDGDTVSVLRSRSLDNLFLDDFDAPRLKIRMTGMDAPEVHLPTPNGMVGQGRWGDAATNYLIRLFRPSKEVLLDSSGTDKYGRTLARVLVENRDLNLAMVSSGQAATYFICSGRECDEDFLEESRIDEYADACRDAQAHGFGIWDRSEPLREMPFEFRLRMQERKPDRYVANIQTGKLYEPKDYKKVPDCDRLFFDRKSDALALGFH